MSTETPKHSPTPWVVGVRYDEHHWPTYRLRDMNDPDDGEEVEANRQIMQVAPGLAAECERLRERVKALEGALEQALEWLTQGYSPLFSGRLALRAALTHPQEEDTTL